MAGAAARQAAARSGGHKRGLAVRAQPVPNLPVYAAHFRLFCITSAGHERKDQAFLVESLTEHIQTHISALNRLEQHGLRFSGLSPDGVLPEIVEYEDHPWFIGVQFHPELKSRPFEPHPLFASFIQAAVVQSRLV